MSPAERTVTPLVSEIETLVAGVHGWSPIDQLFGLSMLAHTTSHLAGDIVEVGSWFGRSAIALGTAVRDTHGKLHCVDLFPEQDDWFQNADGSYSFETKVNGQRHSGYREQTVWGRPFEEQMAPVYAKTPSVLEGFRENIRSSGLESVVMPFRGTAATFVAQLPKSFRCRLIFLDGDHGYKAVREDIALLAPLLVPGGWFCFDDAFSSYEGVNRAITELVVDSPCFDLKRQITRKCFAARKALRLS
jgi:predicted O-methyltransferase YrrM